MSTTVESGHFERPRSGPKWGAGEGAPTAFADQIGWQSAGGPKGHPGTALPRSLDIAPPEAGQMVRRVSIYGIFALWASASTEAPNRPGAAISILGDHGPLYQHRLFFHRHYFDSRCLGHPWRPTGDGSYIETLGQTQIDGMPHRVDRMVLELGSPLELKGVRFQVLDSPASFVIFDAQFEGEAEAKCPFRQGTDAGTVTLSELGAVIRMGDRARLARALSQLERGILGVGSDLDEARSLGLTFLAVLSAAMLEVGGSREIHRLQLEAARSLERLDSVQEIAAATMGLVERVAFGAFDKALNPSGEVIDRAIKLMERHFAKDLSDATVASWLGLSTSHFRYLFREATGQPYHKYLIGLRLENARALLLEGDTPVTEIAEAVGFANAAHFSRMFSQRFHASPSAIRRLK